MTRIEKAVALIVGMIIAVITAVTLIISISLSSTHNDNTHGTITDIGINVLQSTVENKSDYLKTLFEVWKGTNSRNNAVASALKSGYSGKLSEMYSNSTTDEFTFAYFTDAEGNKLWASDTCKLSGFDVSRALADEEFSGFSCDENMPLSYVYVTPVYYDANGYSSLVGVVVLGYNLSNSKVLDPIKEQINSEVSLIAGDSVIATTFTDENGERAVGTEIDPKIYDKLMQGGESITGRAKMQGGEYYIQYEPIADVNGNICGALFTGMSTAESDISFGRVIVTAAIAAVVILIAAIIVIGVFIRRVIARPIVELNKLAEDMSRGRLSAPESGYKFGNNELGDFAAALHNTKNSLNSYISDITEILEAMADGNFTKRPSVEYTGDFERIERAFGDIRQELSEIVHNISRSSEQVLSGSSQMAGGSQILANGTTTQASAIENLNSAVQGISEKINVNADNAVRAKELSAEVETSAVAQNKDMSSVMEAMNEIERKSSEIGKIIKTIDDIAFQTNILALNAAVEAARAGDAGKGFAVVADEVRNLASKSAEAAQLTTELISATVDAVNDGAEKVNSAAESMREITEKAKETSRLIDEISDASGEQATAIMQVTVGLEKISDVVQQNSATAEETAASCEQLSSQSRILKQQVDMLKA
ncbi:MAG: methyl-accepting chemotaxis protein [Huintestinicola sp.]|uniref:methyl-accepting chemotaxis protein n=1 Tax=Huintestinicola sp. TaxID=2981661 RepID=UPI003F08A874